MIAATAAQAIAAAAAESAHPTQDLTDDCLIAVRTFLRVPRLFGTARAAWSHIQPARRHAHTVPPPGSPCFFQTGNAAWHVTLADWDPWWVWSTDILRAGRVDRVPKSKIQRDWAAAWLGWTDTLNGWVVPLVLAA